MTQGPPSEASLARNRSGEFRYRSCRVTTLSLLPSSASLSLSEVRLPDGTTCPNELSQTTVTVPKTAKYTAAAAPARTASTETVIMIVFRAPEPFLFRLFPMP